MSETLKLLILILGSIQIFDILIAVSLYVIYQRNQDYKCAIFIWIGMFLFFISDYLLGTASILHPFISYSFAGVTSIAMGRLVATHYDIKYSTKKFCIIFVLLYTISVVLFFFGIRSFLLLSLVISIGVFSPVLYSCSIALNKLYKKSISGKSYMDYVFVITILIWGIHFLDYPFLRPLAGIEFSLFGFSFALILTSITSILVPVVVNQNIYVNLNETLESKLKAKEAELNQAQIQIIAKEKLASLGSLSSGIAHEIKNPLNIIKNGSAVSLNCLDNIEKIKGELTRTVSIESEEIFNKNIDKLKNISQMIDRNTDRADNIVKSMLLQSRTGESVLKLVDVEALVRENFDFITSSLSEGNLINIEKHFDFSPCEQLYIYPQELGRALLNILENSFFALNEKKARGEFSASLSISTRIEKKFIVIEIADNGTGIPIAIQNKVLEPFFTTKAPGSGTGLGMSMVFEVVKLHQGEILIDSIEDKYTKITLKLSKTLKKV
jgi:signal transduction histidine kinase